MKHITNLHTHGRTFEIVLFENLYWAIEDKYIEDGQLTVNLNAAQANAKKNMWDCIYATEDSCKVDELEAKGINRIVATLMVLQGFTYDEAAQMAAKMH